MTPNDLNSVRPEMYSGWHFPILDLICFYLMSLPIYLELKHQRLGLLLGGKRINGKYLFLDIDGC